MGMMVNAKSARRCCKDCDVDYGHSNNHKAKTKLKRTVRRREKQALRKEL
jgi:hypothetical protein